MMHLTINDFCLNVSRLHDNRFISLSSRSLKSYYFYSVRSIRLWNSLPNYVTCAQNLYYFRRLLSNVNFVPYLRGRL